MKDAPGRIEQVLANLKKTYRGDAASSITLYAFALVLGFLPLIFAIIISPILGITNLFLLFLPAILLSSWYNGLRSGIATTIFLTVGFFYFFLVPQREGATIQPISLFMLLTFLFEGLLISYLIEKSRNSKEIAGYKKREKEYLELLIELKEKNTKAHNEIKARDEFLSIASHELKTPLTAMLLQLQAALHNIRNVSLANFSVENLLKMLNSVEQQTVRVSKMINDLLNVSLITTGRLDLEYEKADLTKIVKDVVERFSEKLKREGYTLTLDAEKSVIGEYDKLRIEQVVSNLLSNAIKYGENKPIEVKVTNSGGMGRITVTDHGIGIPREQQEKVFARFERAVNSSGYKGLGVGLYITNQIVKTHGGSVNLTSREGNGTTFTITLPLGKQSKS